MPDWILGLGVLRIFFLYDWSRVSLKKQQMSHLSTAGSVCLAVVAARPVRPSQTVRFGGWLSWLTGAVVFPALLTYILYFTFPFDSTYCKGADLHTVCRSGIYGWCCHPSIWWFSGCFFCPGMSTSLGERVILCLVLSFLSLLYAWYQDRCIFVAEFSDYEDYKKIAPLLTPNFVQNSKRR